MRLTRLTGLCIGLVTPLGFAAAAHSFQQQQQQHRQQVPLMANPGPAIGQNEAPAVATEAQPLLLADTMASQRSLSIFASLARDDMNASAQFADRDGYTVVLAPTNAALKAMSHKPWEDPDEARALGGHAYKGEPGMDRAQRNLRRFVQSCLVSGGSKGLDWPEGEKRERGEQGKQVWWETKEGKMTIMPENIPVEGVVSRVVNGEVWALEGAFES